MPAPDHLLAATRRRDWQSGSHRGKEVLANWVLLAMGMVNKHMEDIMENKGLLGSLFDLSFSEFVTTRVIKVLFILGLIGAGIGSLMFIWAGFSAGFLKGVLFLILSPLVFLLWTLGARIWCELIIVAFRIAENTSRLVELRKAE
jgi:hypothetical protein